MKNPKSSGPAPNPLAPPASAESDLILDGPLCRREVRFKGVTYAAGRRLPGIIADDPATIARLIELGAI